MLFLRILENIKNREEIRDTVTLGGGGEISFFAANQNIYHRSVLILGRRCPQHVTRPLESFILVLVSLFFVKAIQKNYIFQVGISGK